MGNEIGSDRRTRLLLGSGGLRSPEQVRSWVEAVADFLGGVERVLFVPYACADHDEYLEFTRARWQHSSRVEGIHEAPDPATAARTAAAVFIGGGNTFLLADALQRLGLVEPIRERAGAGVPYIGISAGSNVACPTMKTTNDMPIVLPRSAETLGLVPFQINPHYFAGPFYYETGGGLTPYGGETRDERIAEFHQVNDLPVLGLLEGSMLRVEGPGATLLGTAGARLFRQGGGVEDFVPGDDLSFLLTP